jgi:hypothetical protein
MAGTRQPAKNNMTTIALPPVLVIGFTGHRRLLDEAASRARVTALLAETKASASGLLSCVSSVASGGDLLFAESCLDLGLPLNVLLPLPKNEFRDDFDEPTWERVERVLARALSVSVTGDGAATRDENYYDCGVEVVERSTLLVALWNGEPPRGLGGTAQIVEFAKVSGRPILWVHSRTGALLRINEDRLARHDPELDLLNAVAAAEPPVGVTTSRELAGAWVAKIDAAASRIAPRVRTLATTRLLCSAAAAILTALGSLEGWNAAWLVLGGVFGIAAYLLPAALRMKTRQARWWKLRTGAEIGRSNMALWRAPGPYDVIGPEEVPELAGVLASLSFLKLHSREPVAAVEDFKKEYREGRLGEQIAYFSKHAAIASRRSRIYQVTAAVCTVLAVVVANVTLLEGVADGLALETWQPVLALNAAVLFQVAAIAGALLVIKDYQRRRERYREMQRRLEQWDMQLAAALTWPVLLRLSRSIERALLAEVIEWKSLIRHQKLTGR